MRFSAVWMLLAAALVAAWPEIAPAEVRIATAGPFTGRNVFRGEQIQQGAEMAVADLNAQGGVLAQRVELVIADDACDPEQALAVARRLVAEEVVFVAGHVCSHASIPASKVYEAADVIMISPASTNPLLTDEGGPNVFRVCGRDDAQGQVAGDYLADYWSEGTIAILHDGSTYGEGLATETRRQLARRGIEPALFDSYQADGRDFSALVANLRDLAADVVYVAGYSAEVGLMVRQARDSGYDAQFVTGDGVTNEEFWMITGPAGEGTLGTFGPDPRKGAAAASVVERFRERGFEPIGYTLHTYAAVQAWAQAVEAAGSLDPAAVIETLHKERFETVLGDIAFDENGDVAAPGFQWYVWSDGEYVPASP